LAALSGAKHGGFTARVAALFRELDGSDHRGDQTAIRYALRERMQRGDGLPGFGHRLYPAGDPRAVILLDALKVAANNDRLQRDLALMEQIRTLIHEEPTIDLALTVMERALNLPSGAALALFALGRSAGWIAHALEQYPLDSLIRPRARYVGKTPGNAERI
jgi:citrate synthase